MDDELNQAYLLSWDGATWRDVVRLRAGQVVTVGRSATNKLVLHDDACSRNHCEVFFLDGEWWLRDLESRNGTLVGDEAVSGDIELNSGDIVSIGKCRLAFTSSLDSQPVIGANAHNDGSRDVASDGRWRAGGR